MFTGMAFRMAHELGLHQERSSMGTSIGQSPANLGFGGDENTPSQNWSPSGPVEVEPYEKSAQILLFWCVFTQDAVLSSGTGRVPSIKRHDINVRLPRDLDVAMIRAGPGCVVRETKVEVFPQMVKMMLVCARSIELLNASSSGLRGMSDVEKADRNAQLEGVKSELTRQYQTLPAEVSFGSVPYQAAVRSRQASSYLILHLFYHMQMAFLAQKILADKSVSADCVQEEVPGSTRTHHTEGHRDTEPDNGKLNEALYRGSVKAITDMLTFAKLIDDRALLATFWTNQAFFHAACAYVQDMLQYERRATGRLPEDPSNIASPGQTSPSMILPFEGYSQYFQNLKPRNGAGSAVESTYSYLKLIAKANYCFLRQSVKDMASYYAGAGWVDAVLDQREQGLRDVDLSIVSNKIATFIRLQDLRGSRKVRPTLLQYLMHVENGHNQFFPLHSATPPRLLARPPIVC